MDIADEKVLRNKNGVRLQGKDLATHSTIPLEKQEISSLSELV